jgi:hypothetical protein
METNKSMYNEFESYLKQKNYYIDKEALQDYTESEGLTYELTLSERDFDNRYIIPFKSLNDKDVNLFIKPTAEYKEYINALLDANSNNPDYTYKIDPNQCEVTAVEVEVFGSIATSRASLCSDKRCLILTNQPGFLYERTYPLSYFERAITFQNMGYIEYITLVMSKFMELLNYVNDILYPVLKRADYTCNDILLNKPRCLYNSNDSYTDYTEFTIEFKHPSDRFSDTIFWVSINPFTFEKEVSDNLNDIFNITGKDELYNYLLEHYWKKHDSLDNSDIFDNIPGPFSYLYRDNENINTYINYTHECSEQYYKKRNMEEQLNKLNNKQ